ncbi:NAD(P)-binding protein [Xylariaceae sp. FL1272]|nr:NAD(P)-binding protein [Xylariaceae sp. FL1272]
MTQNTRKSVLITGLCVALRLEYQRRDLFVIATARRPEVLEDRANLNMATMGLDVTDEASIKACHDEDHVHTFPATDLGIADVIETFQSNVFGTMATVKGFIDLLIPAKGLIINSASASALVPINVRVMCAMSGVVRSNISSHGFRALPGSIYQPVKDTFEWRLNFSQAHSASEPTQQFARDFVHASLKPECPAMLSFLRGLVGRPHWYWSGGTASSVYWTHTVGEWLNDMLLYGAMRIDEIEQVLARDAEAKKTT